MSTKRPRHWIQDFLASLATAGDDCIEWPGSMSPNGYGKVCVPGAWHSHRAAYLMHVGPIPDGFHIDHLCRNRACCNPKHLEAVTPWENNRRSESLTARNLAKTHCVNGHPLSGDNLVVHLRDSGVRRYCRTCRRDASYRHYLRQLEAA